MAIDYDFDNFGSYWQEQLKVQTELFNNCA